MASTNWQALLAYVMAFGGLKEPEAATWLDNHCPLWREGQPVETHGYIVLRDLQNKDDDDEA
ncbi:hypothetical protein SJT38_14140 [Aeromonas caviae]|uniref:hypothetical protein n=1 Tax=Aeromonas caviae TaxID=648 RepID=UPI0029DBD5AD|nr:hypothetical protein [Aeromonas caviae]MDX7824240.1 hypothetical protein [Aeromonas caviae]